MNRFRFFSSSSQRHKHKKTLAQRRLTRQRRLRYLSDGDVGLRFHHTSDSDEGSPDQNRDPNPSSLSPSDGRPSSAALPLPLPLPGSPDSGHASATGRKSMDHLSRDTSLDKSVDDCHRRSPLDSFVENVDYLKPEIPITDGPPNKSPSPALRRTPERSNSRDSHPSHAITSSADSSTEYQAGFPQDPKVKRTTHNLKLNTPTESAPTSGLCSPTSGPRKSSCVDMPSSSVAPSPQKYWTFPVLDVPTLGRLSRLSSKVSPPGEGCNPEHSPPQSPKIQNKLFICRSLDGNSFPVDHRLPLGNSMERPDSSSPVNAYPLPLPPKVAVSASATMSPKPVTVHQGIENPNVSIMKGQWQKGKLIGRGTFGSVYVAVNRVNGASCAMKEVDIIPDDPKSAECIKQLEQEITLLSGLKHPNIVQYYGSETIDDHLYIYLEYVFPGSINKYIREHCGAITEAVVRNFTRHILSGLAYLHSSKTIHSLGDATLLNGLFKKLRSGFFSKKYIMYNKDIKAANLLVDASGVVKLADFGLAKHLTGQAYDLSLKGSPYWMAPEVMQAAVLKDANPDLAYAVDIWSLGCTIIEMLTGRPPWSDFEGQVAMFKVLNQMPSIPENLSSEGKDFLRCCFRRNPAERPSASSLLDHPFVRNSCENSILVCTRAFSGMKLLDKSRSPQRKLGLASTETQNIHGNPRCYTETQARQQCNSPVLGHAASGQCAPCSFHEVIPSTSTTQVHSYRHNPSQSSKVLCGMNLEAVNNHICAPLKIRQQEIPHL